ncbi:MAG: hypothetical protein JST69_14590 [Bacteroidetes bacterium]|nr:hypothetical protein [Bacteroidota bacterium]
METLKFKKAKKPAVKNSLLLFFSFMLATTVSGQIIVGTYSTSLPSADVGYTTKFTNGRFYEISYQHLGMKEVSRGYYWTMRDTLFQWYEKTTQPINFIIEKKEKQVDAIGNPIYCTHISIKMIGEKVPVNILLLSKDKKVIKGLVPDSVGHAEIILANHSGVDRILCSSFSDECQFDVADFIGYSSIINVKFSTNSTRPGQYSGLRKLLIKEINKSSMKLLDIDNSTMLMYKLVK